MRGDWISPWWQAAVAPSTWDVCGIIVPPLSVWHSYALDTLENPYLYLSDPDNPHPESKDAAASLLMVACRTHQEYVPLFYDAKARGKAMRRVYRSIRRIPLDDINAACGEYVRECLRHPHRVPPEHGGSTPAGTPEQWSIVSALCDAGWLIEDAWNAPYAIGRCIFDASCERNGTGVNAPHQYGEWMWDHWDVVKNQTDLVKVDLGMN